MLEANIPRVKAQRMLDEYEMGKISPHPDVLYDAVMLITENETLANAYRVGRIKADQIPG